MDSKEHGFEACNELAGKKLRREIPPPTKIQQQDSEIIRLLNALSSDPALKHLRPVLIENMLILEKRHKAYNGEQSVLENCYTDLDATALQNLQQAFVRIKGQCKANGSMLRDVPMNNLEGRELLQDNTNWGLIWQCCRREVKGCPAEEETKEE